jgi:hypothetical protein
MDDEFVPPTIVTEITGISTAALAQLRHRGQGPCYYKPTARIVLYKRSEVLAWVEASVRKNIKEFA